MPYRDPNPFGGTAAERSDAISTYLSYAGRYEMLPGQDTVIHHIEICSLPNWIGKAQVRHAELDSDVLRLTTKPMTVQGVEYTGELVWERVGRDGPPVPWPSQNAHLGHELAQRGGDFGLAFSGHGESCRVPIARSLR